MIEPAKKPEIRIYQTGRHQWECFSDVSLAETERALFSLWIARLRKNTEIQIIEALKKQSKIVSATGMPIPIENKQQMQEGGN